jgi:copper chaperone NosL
MRQTAFSVIILLLLISCSPKPKEIYYGQDGCHYCSMTIVDRQHAAELVTEKGKVYKFDAAECMINYLSEDKTSMAYYLVTDYTKPEGLIDAQSATFIISPNIPSPMRANLSAVAKLEKAIELQELKGGNLYSWDELLIHFRK